MDASEQGDLYSIIELWLDAKEIGRLAERLDRASACPVVKRFGLNYHWSLDQVEFATDMPLALS